MDLTDLLSRFDFYQKLHQDTRHELAKSSREADLEKGTHLFFDEDVCKNVALLLNGEIRVYKVSDSGREITLYHVEPGQTCMLNVASALSGRPVGAIAETIDDCRLILVPGFLLKEKTTSDPYLQNYIFDIISERLVSVMDLISEVVFHKVDMRLLQFLRAQFKDKDSIRLTHEQIAAELGTAREVVSRLLQDIARKGAIQTGRGEIRILNRSLL